MTFKTIASALALIVATPALAQTAPGKAVYIHAGQLLDRPGSAPRGNSTIVVRDGKIVEIRDGFVAPQAGAALVDLKDEFVLPGLIDMHVHLWGIGGDPMRARLVEATNDIGDDMMLAVVNAKTTLDAGFTTVRDLGGNPRGIRALRDGIARGDVEGPTIVNAGTMISITGGHGDGANGLTPMQAIRAATVSAADLLGRDDLGTLAPGKVADIVAVKGSPLEDVRRLEHVDFVMHRGVIARHSAE